MKQLEKSKLRPIYLQTTGLQVVFLFMGKALCPFALPTSLAFYYFDLFFTSFTHVA